MATDLCGGLGERIPPHDAAICEPNAVVTAYYHLTEKHNTNFTVMQLCPSLAPSLMLWVWPSTVFHSSTVYLLTHAWLCLFTPSSIMYHGFLALYVIDTDHCFSMLPGAILPACLHRLLGFLSGYWDFCMPKKCSQINKNSLIWLYVWQLIKHAQNPVRCILSWLLWVDVAPEVPVEYSPFHFIASPA